MASKSESGQEEVLSVGRRYLRDLSSHYERFTKCMNDMQCGRDWEYGTLLRTTEWVKCCFRGGHIGRTLATTTFPTVTDPESIFGELRSVIRFGSENAAMLKRLDTKSDEQALEEATAYNITNWPATGGLALAEDDDGFQYSEYLRDRSEFNHALNQKDFQRYYNHLKSYICQLPTRKDRGTWVGKWRRMREEVLASRTSQYKVIMTGQQTEEMIWSDLQPYLEAFKNRLDDIRSHFLVIKHPSLLGSDPTPPLPLTVESSTSAGSLQIQSADQVPQAHYCPLTYLVMTDPVIDPEGNSYEKSAILEWLSRQETSPVTRSRLVPSMLVPNRALKDALEEAARRRLQ